MQLCPQLASAARTMGKVGADPLGGLLAPKARVQDVSGYAASSFSFQTPRSHCVRGVCRGVCVCASAGWPQAPPRPSHQLTRHRQGASTPLDPECTPGSNTFMTEMEHILHSVQQRHRDSVKPWHH